MIEDEKFPSETKERVDVSRWNRKERRDIRKSAHITIPGRNLPYTKSSYGSIENFNKVRADEIASENKKINNQDG